MRLSAAIPVLTCITLCSISAAKADSYCSENVTGVIVLGDSLYFTTDKSCPNWCQINPNWDATAINRAMSAMMAAKTAGNTVEFEWPGTNTACSVEPTYSNPGVVIF